MYCGEWKCRTCNGICKCGKTFVGSREKRERELERLFSDIVIV